MDIDIVNTILRLCYEQQTCLFEVSLLCDYCLKQHICTNSKHVLASIRNYMEIFKISRDRNRIEFFMPFEICRNYFLNSPCQTNGDICPNLHVCYDYFYTNACRRSISCPYPHELTERSHGNNLGSLNNLDLDGLTKAFRVYCQSKKHSYNHISSGMSLSRGSQVTPSASLINNAYISSTSSSSSSSSNNTWRLINTPQVSSNASWKANHRTTFTSKLLHSTQLQQTTSRNLEKGLQICWTPLQDIQTHFIEVVFSNPGKSNGGPIRTHTLYQHLGVAQLFYQHTDIIDRVINRGPVTFQSFTFTSRLLQRTIDTRHLCFLNMSLDTSYIPLYIDAVSMPYKTNHFEYYHNDQQTIVVEYDEDIDFAKISSNVRNHPECSGLPIKCIQLYHPETLLIEYDQEYSEDEIKKIFKNGRIFHIKIYTFCAFVHFYSHDDLICSIKTSFENPICVTPIYIDIFSQKHLDNYLKRRRIELQTKPISIENTILSSINGTTEDNDIHKTESVPITHEQSEILSESELVVEEDISPIKSTEEEILNEENLPSDIDENIENEIQASDDDFHDLPSEFDDDDLFLDETIDTNGDMEFLRSAAKNLMSSLAEMEAASSNANTLDAPHSLLYGDDYIVTIKSRRFAIAFLDYTQFRVEKQRNPDKFRLLASLKKQTNHNQINQKKRKDTKQRDDDTPSPISNIESDLLATLDTKSNKKKRNKRNKKKKNTYSNTKDKSEPLVESGNDGEEDEEDETSHVINNQEYSKNDFPTQRLPHVYLDDDLKPCIVVTGEEHHDENEQEMSEHDDWHNIVAGGKPVLVSKKSKNRKQHKGEKPKVEVIEQIITTSTVPVSNVRSNPSVTDSNSVIIPANYRGFLHHPKLYETFRLRLRRSFPSINIRLESDTYTIIIDGNNKLTVQQCLQYLHTIQTFKHSLFISFDNFPSTTVTDIIRMQQSTAQVKLISDANYNRIFRSTDRLIDYQLKQQYNQQQCIYCRRSRKQFKITYLEFPREKQSIKEINESIQQRILQLLNTRFTYIAIALSADLMTTKRWAEFYKNLIQHKDMNKTLLIRKINTIIQVYGLHAHVQQIQTLITKFLDTNRYETDIIETEQASGIFSLFKQDFHEMENLDIFREAELRFVYYHHRHTLFFQCFQEKFETVKTRIQNMRSHLSTVLLPVKSPILSRHYSKSNELQTIAATSACIITIEKRVDQTRSNDNLISLKIIGQSSDHTTKAQRLIKEFEEQKYSTQRIQNNDIHLLNDQDFDLLRNECNTCNVSCTIDRGNNIFELEGLSGDFIQIEKIINDLCLIAARRALDDLLYSTQWIYYDGTTNKPVAFGEIIKQQLEKCFIRKQQGIVNLKDHTGRMRTFDFDKMIEIIHDKNSLIHVKIERRDSKNHQTVKLPTHWMPMTKSWDRILLAKRENTNEWKTNAEIQRLLKLPHMLPESWLIEIYRVQNPRMFQQYVAHRDNFAARSQATERILYRLTQDNLVDDVCAHGFNQSHTDSSFSVYGHGCHFYCKAIDIARTATLLANSQIVPIHIQQQQQQQTPIKPSVRFLFVCKVLVGRYTRGEASMKTCPPGYDSLVDNIQSPEVFVTHHDAQVLPEYLIAYHSAIF